MTRRTTSLGLIALLTIALAPAAAAAAPAALDRRELAALPDDAARAAAQAFADAVEQQDAAALAALVPDAGLKLLKRKRTRRQVQAILDRRGVAGLLGTAPRGMLLSRDDVQAGVTYGWHVELARRRFLLYTVEYGLVREALFARVGKDWKLVELRDADHGEP